MIPSSAKSTPPLPAAIGRYRILSRLGKGAMGVVYSARDDQLERNVALKVMMADLESDPETRARFYREAQITGKLLHRNIITVFDLAEENGRLYLVMELLNGSTLAEFSKGDEPASLEQKLDLMIQTCEGLASAHARDVVHRDVKPSNLFVQSDGGLKILDFGIARLASSNMTMSGMIMGTPDYMSPEQAQGREVDARSDIFSAAGVFYFMVTGRRPFEAAELPVVLHKVMREDPLPIRAHEAPAALAQVITKGLQKNPAQRYQRCGDMAADIIRFKRQFDNETRRLIALARERFDRVLELVPVERGLRAVLEIAKPDSDVDVDQLVRERYPFFAKAERDVASIAPLTRTRVTAMLDELNDVLVPLSGTVDTLRRCLAEIEAGESAMENEPAAVLRHFQHAAAAIEEPSPRVAAALAKAKETLGPHGEQLAAAGPLTLVRVDDRARADAVARSAQALACWNRGEFDKAFELANEATQLDPALPEAIQIKSLVSARLREQAEAAEREAARLLDNARKQLHAGHADRASWSAENVLRGCPGYLPAQQLLSEARAALEVRMQTDPDETVRIVREDRPGFDPAATVVIDPAVVRRGAAATDGWASRIRRRFQTRRKG